LLRKINNIAVNFKRKDEGDYNVLLYTLENNPTNIQSEVIDKSTIISTQRWTNGLGTAHSKMGGPTFVK